MKIIKEVPVCRFGSYLFEFSNNEYLQLIKNKTTEHGFKLFVKQIEEDVKYFFIHFYDPSYEYKFYFNSYEELGIDEEDGDFANETLIPFFNDLNDQYMELYDLIHSKFNSDEEEYKLAKHYTTKNNNIVINIRYNLPFI